MSIIGSGANQLVVNGLLGSAAYFDVKDLPASAATQGAIDAAIAGLATVARTGSYDDLTDKVPTATELELTEGTQTGARLFSPKQIAAIMPAGTVIAFAAENAPEGYLKCNGALVSRSAYSNLFANIGTSFGGGDGSTTFKLPDLRGEFVRGWQDGRAGVDGSRSLGSSQSDMFKSHSHSFRAGMSGSSGSGISQANGSASRSVDSEGGTETRPRNVALLYCIKY